MKHVPSDRTDSYSSIVSRSRHSVRLHSQTKGTLTGSASKRRRAASILSFAARNLDSFSAIRRASSGSMWSGFLATGVELLRQLGGPSGPLLDDVEGLVPLDDVLDVLDLMARLDDEPGGM